MSNEFFALIAGRSILTNEWNRHEYNRYQSLPFWKSICWKNAPNTAIIRCMYTIERWNKMILSSDFLSINIPSNHIIIIDR